MSDKSAAKSEKVLRDGNGIQRDGATSAKFEGAINSDMDMEEEDENENKGLLIGKSHPQGKKALTE